MSRIGFGGTEETRMSIKHATSANEERSNATGSAPAQDVSDLQSHVNITHCLEFCQFSNPVLRAQIQPDQPDHLNIPFNRKALLT
ncbi:hypothetical protein CEP52_002899 [Fusarium oligoseptatum]|uniref:Uncharacterized protein n=1 Tax=Fusarium oligoseptatum TaxID=2604345 RepID=A0A428UBP2_9HYPO|nr:hypothetical protein CEP52_002899 [Fusarium oligoseptatum]